MNIMRCKVYYQDLRLNALAFDNSQLIVDKKSAVFIREAGIEEYYEAFGKTSLPDKDVLERADIPEAVFAIMNLLDIPEGHKDRALFEKAGHTSMSVGDFVEFEDGELWIVAQCGWEIRKPEKPVRSL